jgi:hypothetical protein
MVPLPSCASGHVGARTERWMRTVVKKKPKQHRGVPAGLNPELADDLPNEFMLQWQDPPVNEYKVVRPDHFDRLLSEILVWREDAPLPGWAGGEGWRNVAQPDQVECRRRRWSQPKSPADYGCVYRHRLGDSDRNRNHDVTTTLGEMVFVEPAENGYPDYWLPRYK